jgi:crotonobetaine/carnitine-CoA ligase
MNTVTGLRTIPTFLEFHANTRPDVTAVTAESNAGVVQSLTWAELRSLVNRASHWLTQQGLQMGDTAVLHIPNSLEFYIFWLAGCRTGVVSVPVDPRSSVPELHYIVNHAGARLMITLEETLSSAKSACEGCSQIPRLVTTSLSRKFSESELGAQVTRQTDSDPSHKPLALDLAGLLYTSGTTGKPKGVMLSHAAYLYGGEIFARSTGLTRNDRHIIPLPLHHAAAQCHAMTPSLVAGTSIVIVERFSASRFLERAAHYGATRAALFGAPLRMLLRHHAQIPVPANPLQLITFAQNLTAEEMDAWEAKFRIPLIQLWGMTETTGLPLMTPLHGPRNPRCMGLPVAGYEVKIVDEAGNDAPLGTAGQIVVRVEPGWTATSGYYKNPAATVELIRDGWLYTGDRAMQDENGEFHFLGRFKEMIKRSGENISPQEIEDTLKEHPDVLDAAVVGVPDPLRDEKVVAFLIARPGTLTSTQAVQDWCKQRLSAFKIPEDFEWCEEFPRTSVGKLQRHLLREPYLRKRAET